MVASRTAEKTPREPGDAPRARRVGWRVALLALAGTLLVGAHLWLSRWYDRTWVFLSAVGLVFALVLLLDYAFALLGPPVLRVLGSLVRSAWRGLAADPEVTRWRQRHPVAALRIARRFDPRSPRGLPLTLIVLVAAWAFGGFVGIAEDVVTASAITHVDPQLAALLRAFRTPVLTRVLWVFTVLGDTRVAASLTALLAVVALLWGRRREAALLVASVAGGSTLVALAKLAFHRARPDAALALITSPASFSFPSGHAMYTMLLFGTLGFLLARVLPGLRVRLFALAACAVPVALTGVSRVYLGVHWPSDVLASWLLALSWLTVTCGGFLVLARFAPAAPVHPAGTRALRVTATAFALVAAGVALVVGAEGDPLLASVSAAPVPVVWRVHLAADGTPDPTRAQLSELPLFSEKLDGSPQEPVGLIFVGTEAELRSAFSSAGWSVAEKPSAATLLRAVVAASGNRPYPTAPVTPTFLGGAVQDLAFEKPEGSATVRRRHHTRWWRTRYRVGEAEVWVATASFDSRLEIGSAIPLPTHHIDPDIDAEQRYIVSDLTAAGLRAARTLRVTDPMTGTDAQGDAFFTEGRATLLVPTR